MKDAAAIAIICPKDLPAALWQAERTGRWSLLTVSTMSDMRRREFITLLGGAPARSKAPNRQSARTLTSADNPQCVEVLP